MAAINFTRLLTQLNVTGLQQSNQPLYQVLSQLIQAVKSFETTTVDTATSTGGSVTALLTKTYLTATDETGTLINSRELLAGTHITFDDAVAGDRTVNASGGSQWSVLTNGDVLNPELIYALGDVIMLEYP
jgi:hypothetical protein